MLFFSLSQILADAKADLSAADKDGFTPVLNAAIGGHTKALMVTHPHPPHPYALSPFHLSA